MNASTPGFLRNTVQLTRSALQITHPDESQDGVLPDSGRTLQHHKVGSIAMERQSSLNKSLISADDKSELSEYERCIFPRLNGHTVNSYRLTGKNLRKPFASNTIRTALYTPYSFFPVAFML